MWLHRVKDCTIPALKAQQAKAQRYAVTRLDNDALLYLKDWIMSLLKAIRNALSSEKEREKDKPSVSPGESARQRLRILLINDRYGLAPNAPDYLPKLRQEIIEVVRKYIPLVNSDDLEINYSNTDDAHILEMSISIDNVADYGDDDDDDDDYGKKGKN